MKTNSQFYNFRLLRCIEINELQIAFSCEPVSVSHIPCEIPLISFSISVPFKFIAACQCFSYHRPIALPSSAPFHRLSLFMSLPVSEDPLGNKNKKNCRLYLAAR